MQGTKQRLPPKLLFCFSRLCSTIRYCMFIYIASPFPFFFRHFIICPLPCSFVVVKESLPIPKPICSAGKGAQHVKAQPSCVKKIIQDFRGHRNPIYLSIIKLIFIQTKSVLFSFVYWNEDYFVMTKSFFFHIFQVQVGSCLLFFTTMLMGFFCCCCCRWKLQGQQKKFNLIVTWPYYFN